MNARQRLRGLWASVPSFSRGRLDLGGLHIVVLSRRQLQESSEQHLRLGARLQRDDPAFLAGLEERDNPTPPRRLRAV